MRLSAVDVRMSAELPNPISDFTVPQHAGTMMLLICRSQITDPEVPSDDQAITGYQTTIKDNKSVTEVVTETEKHMVPIDSTGVKAAINLDYRQKGLLWYSTYKVRFAGTYTIANSTSEARLIHMSFPLPAQQAIYDNFQLSIGSRIINNIRPADNSLSETFLLGSGESQKILVSYDSQGLSTWHYSFGSAVNQVKNFTLELTTNFAAVDFTPGSMSPVEKKKIPGGWQLTWRYSNLLTGYDIGLKLPEKLNPGPWVSKVTFFAPVSLFLFFFLLFVFTTVKGIKVHPMNYFFIAAAFFSFHLLLAYLVDHMQVDAAFAISSFVSVFLVVSYMRLVVSSRFAFVEIGVSQLIYLVLFSYTFFFEQYTGLTVTIMCILTLFIMMQFTGRIDWSEVFSKSPIEKKGLPKTLPPSISE